MSKFNFMENVLINNIVFDDSEKIKNREIKSNKYKCSKIIISSKSTQRLKKFFFWFLS